VSGYPGHVSDVKPTYELGAALFTLRLAAHEFLYEYLILLNGDIIQPII
jgi:hypothetical protein